MKGFVGMAPGGRSALLVSGVSLLLVLAFSLQAAASDALQDRMKFLSKSKEPVTVQADNIEYDKKTGLYTATGSVRITQEKTELTAEKVTLDRTTGDAEATGKARLVTNENVLFAERMKVNFNTQLGVVEKGNIFVQRKNYHIAGESLERVSKDEYVVKKGGMTTCDGDFPVWRVTAGSLDVRMDRDVTARNVVLRVKDIPVFYTPYAWFPLLKPRTTGFLLPGIGYSTRDGARLLTSFFWAPADNFDATVSADYRAARGVGIASEVRLALDKDTITDLSAYYLDDRKEDRERYKVSLKHQEEFTDSLSGRVDINLSDRQFYRELTDTAKERTQRSIDSNVFLTNRWDWGRAYMFGQFTQGLDINNAVTVQSLPELGFNVLKWRIPGAPVYFDLDASAGYFYKKKGVDGSRYDIFPKLTGEFNMGGINITPKVGYRETAYSLAGKGKDNFGEERGLFGAGVSMQTGFYRLYTFSGGPLEGVRHTLEPAAAYNIVLERGGRVFPKFDGIDTYGKRNMLAYSLTNRFVIKYRGAKDAPRVDYVTLKLSQFYDFYKQNTILGKSRYISGLYGEIVYKAARLLTLNNDFRYDYKTGTFLSIDTDVRFSEQGGMWHVLLGQRFSKDTDQTFISPSRFDFFTPRTDFVSEFVLPKRKETKRLNFLTAEAGVKIDTHWEVSGRVWYDVHNQNLRETGFSSTYSSQCWGITMHYVKRPGEQQVLVTLDLKGLGTARI